MNLSNNILTPDSGMCLTQASDVVVESRIFASMVALPSPEYLSQWREITLEEADAIRLEQERLINQRIAQAIASQKHE